MIGAHTGLTEKVLSYKPSNPPIEEIQPPRDRAFFADPEKKSLLSAVTKVKHLTPYIGTELQGIQISKLDEKQKDELALLVAEVHLMLPFKYSLAYSRAERSGLLQRPRPRTRRAIRALQTLWNCKSRNAL